MNVADDDAPQDQRPGGTGGETRGLFEEQFGDAAADGAAAEQRDAERFHESPWRGMTGPESGAPAVFVMILNGDRPPGK